jgi:proteasome lid subunit RPN8/RPN11
VCAIRYLGSSHASQSGQSAGDLYHGSVVGIHSLPHPLVSLSKADTMWLRDAGLFSD